MVAAVAGHVIRKLKRWASTRTVVKGGESECIRRRETTKFDLLLAQGTRNLPALDDRILDEVLLKKTDAVDEIWQPRQVILTDLHIIFGRVDGELVNDQVPLADIKCIVSTSEMHEGTSEGGQNERSGPYISDGNYVIEILTKPDGLNTGRNYLLKTDDVRVAQEWTTTLREQAKLCADEVEEKMFQQKSATERVQHKCRILYTSTIMQTCVAVLIVANFFIRIIDVEVMAEEGSEMAQNLETVDLCFTVVFALELCLNMFGRWTFEEGNCVPDFFLDAWNLFDFVVVTVSVVALGLDGVPGISILRLLRVFRVLRLFPRLKSLRVIINAMTAAIVPCMNAVMVLVLFTCIYAVIAVSLFADADPVQFRNFSAAVYTMFQVCTGDGWSTDVVRPLFEGRREDGHVDATAAIFFVSYIMLAGYFLLNIIVAVLLDEFVRSVESERSESAEQEAAQQSMGKQHLIGALDPLIQLLFRYDTSKDLSDRIDYLFDFFDVDGTKELTYPLFIARLHAMASLPRMHVSRDDWDVIMFGHQEPERAKDRAVSKSHFNSVMKSQMTGYCQRYIEAQLLHDNASNSHLSPVFFIFKHMMLLMERNSGSSQPESSDPAKSSEADLHQSMSDDAQLAAQGSQMKALKNKTDGLDKKLDLILQRLGINADEGPTSPEGPAAQQHGRKKPRMVSTQDETTREQSKYLPKGIVQSNVFFTLAAASQIRATMQQLIRKNLIAQASNESAMSPRHQKSPVYSVIDALIDSDSSDESHSSVTRVIARKNLRRLSAGNGGAHGDQSITKTMHVPSTMMSQRKRPCMGCDNCVEGISVIGVMIYSQTFPPSQELDEVQELKSHCITRAVKKHSSTITDPAGESQILHISAIAGAFLKERLPLHSSLVINPNAYIDSPLETGHVQRCYLVPKLSAEAEMHKGWI